MITFSEGQEHNVFKIGINPRICFFLTPGFFTCFDWIDLEYLKRLNDSRTRTNRFRNIDHFKNLIS